MIWSGHCTLSVCSAINEALSHDERGNTQQALACYQNGVQLLEKALALDVIVDGSSELRSKHEKMIITLNSSKARVHELTSRNTGNVGQLQFLTIFHGTYKSLSGCFSQLTVGSLSYVYLLLASPQCRE